MKLQQRLDAIMRDGNLTVADLARWFERPHPTVRGWTKGGSVGGPHQDKMAIEKNLSKLENMLKAKKGLPVPQMSPARRIEYLEARR